MSKPGWKVSVVICPRIKTSVLRFKPSPETGWKRWLPRFEKEPVELPGAPLDPIAFGEVIEREIEKLESAGYEIVEFLPWTPTAPPEDRRRLHASHHPMHPARKWQMSEPSQGLLIVAKRGERVE